MTLIRISVQTGKTRRQNATVRWKAVILISYGCCNTWAKLGGEEQQEFIPSQLGWSGVQNQFSWAEMKVSAGLCSLQRLHRRICSLPLSASGDYKYSLTCGHITPNHVSIFQCLLCVSIKSPCPLSSKDTNDGMQRKLRIGITQDDLLL